MNKIVEIQIQIAPSKAKLIVEHNYIINVASAKNGICYEKWIKINGFSEAVINWIIEYENSKIL